MNSAIKSQLDSIDFSLGVIGANNMLQNLKDIQNTIIDAVTDTEQRSGRPGAEALATPVRPSSSASVLAAAGPESTRSAPPTRSVKCWLLRTPLHSQLQPVSDRVTPVRNETGPYLYVSPRRVQKQTEGLLYYNHGVSDQEEKGNLCSAPEDCISGQVD
ncbi:unnamed protein product [Arctia plantaginis]|uniref:Uncharacterized protein n=1 Tax=Arctia plantaginis TaxID=874455 RepID=A0A8S0ZNC6_ARCPL|nr:unnamed protein product [Arctia plantaginis]